jgi:NADPH2:quinone reductase
VLGRDFAGVQGFEPGTRVFGAVLTIPLQAGGFGEYVIVPSSSLARVPEGMELAAAGVVGLAGSAATTLLDALAPRSGETVLISGATGGVGSLLIQLVLAQGATVLATAAPGPETELVSQLGATHLIDHTGDVAAQVRELAPSGVDVVVHLAGDPFALADLVRPGGRFGTLLGVGQEQLGDRELTAHAVNATLRPAPLEDRAAQIVAGKLVVPVQRSYSLEEVPQAFADFTSGTLGKLSIIVA